MNNGALHHYRAATVTQAGAVSQVQYRRRVRPGRSEPTVRGVLASCARSFLATTYRCVAPYPALPGNNQTASARAVLKALYIEH